MTYPATNLNEAVALIVPDSNALHEIINGDASTEVPLPEGGTAPSVRKALVDGVLFKNPILWNNGQNITDPLQLVTFTNGVQYYAPTATSSTPIPMGVTPEGDSNWKIAPVNIEELRTYKGEWVTGSEAKYGDIWYYQDYEWRALVNTQNAPSEGAEWRNLTLQFGASITFLNDNFGSAVDNMVAGRISGISNLIKHKKGNIYSTGGTEWECAVDNATNLSQFRPIAGVHVDDFGADPTRTNDSTFAIYSALNAVPYGGRLNLSVGTYLVTNIVHPKKPVHWFGCGVHDDFKTNISGTAIEGTLNTFTPVLYFPGPDPVNSRINQCRHSSLNNLSVHGNGIDDDTGNMICIKINNQGTMLNNVNTRYGVVGVECNSATAQKWENCSFTASTFSVWFRYDPDNPYINDPLGEVSWATANEYSSIRVHTSPTNTSAVGWLVEATCNYGQNTHTNIDFESCYVGCRLEGRIASRDYQRSDGSTVEAYGAAAWQGTGNQMTGCWWERNTSFNIELRNDVGDQEARIGFQNIFQDEYKILLSNEQTSNFLISPDKVKKLKPDTLESDSLLSVGEWNSPMTANQYLINGPTINVPIVRSIVREGIPLSSSNRTINQKSTYEFSAVTANLPLQASALKIGEIDMFSSYKNAVVNINAVATGDTGASYALVASYLVSNVNDVISQVTLVENFNSIKIISCGFLRESTNKFGIYVWKEPASSVLRSTFDIKVIISGDHTGGFDSSFEKSLSIA